MKKMTLASGILAAALAATAAWAGVAGDREDADGAGRDAITRARITLSDAAAAAERRVGGRAYEAEIEEERGALFFEVEVVGPSGPQEVRIDAQTGAVLEVHATDADDDD